MNSAKVLVIGSGGREHAIAHKLNQSNEVSQVFIAPGNAGMEQTIPGLGRINIESENIQALLEFALSEKIELTIVGPEAVLSLGIVDLFKAHDLLIVGCTKAASLLETSKAFAKKIMNEAQVPTAAYCEFFDSDKALQYIEESCEDKMVVKCDGLASGKGVIVCQSKQEARVAVNALMRDKLLGENVDHIIIEDFLLGTEVSAFALCDGNSFSFLGTACDHKRLRDGDLGPNTGGMGVFSPASCFGPEDEEWINKNVFAPMLSVMAKKGIPFSGILFAGLMKTNKGWSVLEFNVRLGDPETQVLLPLIDEDLFPWFKAMANSELNELQIKFGRLSPKRSNESGIHVVMAAHGYPGTEGIKIRKGDEIKFAQDFSLSHKDYLFFAGVAEKDSNLVTNGGRILGITSIGETIFSAREVAYDLISKIHFEGAQYRQDIGKNKVRIAILASGSGSNAEAIMKWAKDRADVEVVCVGANKKEALVLSRARALEVPEFCLLKRKNEDAKSFDERLLNRLSVYRPDFIVLAGYMKLLSGNFIEKFNDKIINIHPSLLPLFPGMDGYGEAYRSDVSESGCTVHYVDAGLDTGKIIEQRKFQKIAGESFEDFKKRGLAIENQFYPQVLEKIIKGLA